MHHKRPRGHSNCYPDGTEPYRVKPSGVAATGRASIPLVGGSRADTCRPLPPLSLSREEWQEIGRRMGWDVAAAPPAPAEAAGRHI